MFPDWVWLRSVNQFSYVTPERAKALQKRCELKSSPFQIDASVSVAAGFGDAETNALVEKAAMRKVTQQLERRGFKVRSRERDRVGYDRAAIGSTVPRNVPSSRFISEDCNKATGSRKHFAVGFSAAW